MVEVLSKIANLGTNRKHNLKLAAPGVVLAIPPAAAVLRKAGSLLSNVVPFQVCDERQGHVHACERVITTCLLHTLQ